LFLLTLLLVSGAELKAQVRTFLSPYSFATDTVVNAGTAYVSIHNPGAKTSTTVWAILDKQSGTVGGVITLQVSVDGVTWKAMNTTGTQTAMATVAAVGDADNTFHWWFPGNPFNYYRVSYTGVTGPMQATIAAKLLSR
jgi:hypothetical protein